jgi:site-specific recombinase XerD
MRQYKRSWKLFKSFVTLKLHSSHLPATSYTTALYVTHLHQSGLKNTTIKTHLSAIAYFHKINYYEDPTKSFTIQKLLKAYQRKAKPPQLRRPITRNILQRLLTTISSSTFPPYHKILFKALFAIMYHAALRIGEVTTSTRTDHNLTTKQIKIKGTQSSKRLTIHFRTYKHSPATTTPLVIHSSNSPFCPVALFQQLRAHHYQKANHPAFSWQDGSPLTRNFVVDNLHTLLSQMGLPPQAFNSHSFRIGRATDMAQQGYSYPQIATLGRWQSNAFLRYIKPTVVHAPRP